MRRPLVIYDFATDPFCISLYMRKILFSFSSVWTEEEILVQEKTTKEIQLKSKQRGRGGGPSV
jgi:hypothetical protein